MRNHANQAVLSPLVLCLAAALMVVEAHAESKGHVVEYYHVDALGSVVAMSDAHGDALSTRAYEPYGHEFAESQDGPGYTAHVSDPGTGLVYMQQRYYDPTIGRFLSVDPVAANPDTGASFSRYIYAANNPYRFTDPDGRDCISKDGTTTCSIQVTGSRIPTKISFATPAGVFGTQKSGSAASHSYNYQAFHQKSDKAVQQSIANDPTPGRNDKPATPTGTLNKATPDGGRGVLARAGALLGYDPDSPVKSYRATDRNGNTWTINVTQPGHGLHFGYVLRGSVGGQVMTIGEGWAIPQAFGFASDAIINDVWKDHNQKNIDDAR